MEFALLLPFLLVVLLAFVQVGLVARDQLMLAAAVRDGAREAAAGGVDASVQGIVGRVALGDLSVVITRSPEAGGPVSVVATAISPIRAPVLSWLIDDVPVAAEAVMRQESGEPV